MRHIFGASWSLTDYDIKRVMFSVAGYLKTCWPFTFWWNIFSWNFISKNNYGLVQVSNNNSHCCSNDWRTTRQGFYPMLHYPPLHGLHSHRLCWKQAHMAKRRVCRTVENCLDLRSFPLIWWDWTQQLNPSVTFSNTFLVIYYPVFIDSNADCEKEKIMLDLMQVHVFLRTVSAVSALQDWTQISFIMLRIWAVVWL